MDGALFAVPFGLAIGISLGLVGGGGSILAVPVLVYVLGEPVKEATTASLLIVGLTALAGSIAHARQGRVNVRLAVAFGSSGLLGAIAGTALNRTVSPETILLGLAALMLAAAWATLRRSRQLEFTPHTNPRIAWGRVTLAGIGVGALAGFFGVGGGFVIVPALVLLLGLEMGVAIGTSLLVIALTSASAFAVHLASGGINWTIATTFALAGIAGALTGSRLGRNLSSARLTQLFAVLIISVAVFLIAKNGQVIA